ncbi:MAG: NUDIX hydrolase [Bacilli bacterium]|nr:NUDIX hydrolase [Bacilli bacterium]
MDKVEKKLSSKVVYDGKIFTVTKDDVLCQNGEKAIREIVHHRGGVGILFKVDDKFIFEKQYRYALEEEIIEMPAGKLEEGEIPLEAAKRELLEETGYRPLEMIHLGDSYPTPGYSSEVIHLYYCPKAAKEVRHLDSDENIDLIYFTLEEIEKLIAENAIKDSKTVAAIYLYKSKILGV